MSENRIDVVAVLDADIAEHERRILRGELSLSTYDSVNAKRQARDAIAELIDADREYDAAKEAWQTSEKGRKYVAAHKRFIASGVRRRAAIARVTPEIAKDYLSARDWRELAALGCGACGDNCATREVCRLKEESPSPRIYALAAAIRSEGDLSARAGQADRLYAIADELVTYHQHDAYTKDSP